MGRRASSRSCVDVGRSVFLPRKKYWEIAVGIREIVMPMTGSVLRSLVAGAAFAAFAAAPSAASADTPVVTATSVDPQFTKPFIDVDEWRDGPVHHRYVHGGF